jgi:hypothetical protein
MNRNSRAIGATLGMLVFFAVEAHAQLTAGVAPNPPPQICVNGQCTTSPTSPPPAPTGGGGHIKWNPGHYMASGGVVRGGASSSFMQWELPNLNNQDAIIGYRMMITWGALEPTPGNYDFSVIDATLAQLKTAYNKPKHLVIMLWLYGQWQLGGNNDGNIIPTYILQNPIYGPSPVSGSYGWWGVHNNGASTGLYAPALYTQPVMDRLIALVQALGRHLDGDPYFEGLFIQEDAAVMQAAGAGGSSDPRYSDGAWVTQLERLLSASTAALPHTSVLLANTWLARAAPTIALEQWMDANRIAASSADTVGQSAISTYGVNNLLSWGILTYLGGAQYGGSDMRPNMTSMMDIEEPDMVGGYFSKYGGPFTPLDIINALNQTYYASHAFWTYLSGSNFPAAVQWPALAATCAANPLTHTGYPANYP